MNETINLLCQNHKIRDHICFDFLFFKLFAFLLLGYIFGFVPEFFFVQNFELEKILLELT